MKPMDRIDIIVGKLKPMADKPKMKMERGPDKMQSKDFIQEVDMDEDSMAYEAAGEAILQAVKQSDAKALAQAICDLMEIHMDHEGSESPAELMSEGEE